MSDIHTLFDKPYMYDYFNNQMMISKEKHPPTIYSKFYKTRLHKFADIATTMVRFPRVRVNGTRR